MYKFRDRQQYYTKKPPFPRPRGYRYNLPDAMIARILPSAGGSSSVQVLSGLYTGDGQATQVITGIGFTPDMVFVKSAGATSNESYFRTSNMPATESFPFIGGAKITNGILSIDADGFTVGPNSATNNSGKEYRYFALKDSGGLGTNIAFGSYNGVGGTPTIPVGFQPVWGFVKRDQATSSIAYHRSSVMPATESMDFAGSAPITNGITDLTSTGFTLGANVNVNQSGGLYYYVMFKGGAGIEVSSYEGTGVAQTITTAFPPDLVIVKPGISTNHCVWRSSAGFTGADSSKFTQQPDVTNSITALGSTGFTIGTDDDVNTNGVTYYSIAFRGGLVASTNTVYSPGSIQIASYTNKPVVVSAAPSANVTLPGQLMYPLAMESSRQLYAPANQEVYIHSTIYDSADESIMGHDFEIFDGAMLAPCDFRKNSAYITENGLSKAFGYNKANSFALFHMENQFGDILTERILRWNYNDTEMQYADEMSLPSYSGYYTGNGVLATTPFSTTLPSLAVPLLNKLLYVPTSASRDKLHPNAWIMVKSTSAQPMIFQSEVNSNADLFDSATSRFFLSGSGGVRLGESFEPLNPSSTNNNYGSLRIWNSNTTVRPYVNNSGQQYSYLTMWGRTWEYTGIGTSNSASDFEPMSDPIDFVIIKGFTGVANSLNDTIDQSPVSACFWTAAHPTGESSLLGPYANITDGMLGVGGLTADNEQMTVNGVHAVRLGTNAAVNTSGRTYRAFASPERRFKDIYYTYGSYVGNGTSQTISLPFASSSIADKLAISWVLVKGNNTSPCNWKWHGHAGADSVTTEAVANISNGITSMSMSSFTVGNDASVNASDVTYYWAAMTRDITPPGEFSASFSQALGYNYTDQCLYWWQENGIEATSLSLPRTHYGTLVRYNHVLNKMEAVARSSYTTRFAHSADDTEPFGSARLVFHPVTNRLYWKGDDGVEVLTWAFDDPAIRRSFKRELYSNSAGHSFDVDNDVPTTSSSAIIAFGNSVYLAVCTMGEIGSGDDGDWSVFRNDTGNADGWELDFEILNDQYWHDPGAYNPVFGTLWPDGATEPTELFLYLNTGFTTPPGSSNANDLLGSIGNGGITFRKPGVDADWVFDSHIQEDGKSGNTSLAYPSNQFGGSEAQSGSGATKTFNVPNPPDLLIVRSRTTGDPAYWRTSSMPGDTMATFNGSGEVSGLITQSTSDAGNSTITITGHTHINGSGKTYDWIEAPNIIRGAQGIASGSYGGNGISGTEIEVPFVPRMVWVKDKSSSPGWWRTEDMPDTYSSPFTTGPLVTNKILRLSVTAPYKRGFTIGDDTEVNDPTKVYWWVAFADNVCVTRTWIGNQTDRVIACDRHTTQGESFNLLKMDGNASNPCMHRFGQGTGTTLTTDLNGVNQSPWQAPQAETGSNAFFLSAGTIRNMGGNVYYWAGLNLNRSVLWDATLYGDCLFSIHGRMCLIVQGILNPHGESGNSCAGTYVISRSPEGKWGISSELGFMGNSRFKNPPTSDGAGIGAYTLVPNMTITYYGPFGGGVVGLFRDQNKQ